MKRFLISIPEELHDELRLIGKTNGYTLTGLIRQILWDWLKKNQDEADRTA